MRSLLAAIEERNRVAGSPQDDWGVSATISAAALYHRAEHAKEAELEVVIPLSQLVRASVAEARMLAENDPGTPGLERRCYLHFTEVNLMISVFAHRKCKEYTALCDSQKSFLNVIFGDAIAEVWHLVRSQAARSKPPTPPKRPPTDNHEYYELRKTEPKPALSTNKSKTACRTESKMAAPAPDLPREDPQVAVKSSKAPQRASSLAGKAAPKKAPP